jgi:hypothetical protein
MGPPLVVPPWSPICEVLSRESSPRGLMQGVLSRGFKTGFPSREGLQGVPSGGPIQWGPFRGLSVWSLQGFLHLRSRPGSSIQGVHPRDPLHGVLTK